MTQPTEAGNYRSEFYYFESSAHFAAWLDREIDEQRTFGAATEFRVFPCGVPTVEPVRPVKSARTRKAVSS